MKHDVSDIYSEQERLLAQTRAAEVQARMSVLMCDMRGVEDRTAVDAVTQLAGAISRLAEAVIEDPDHFGTVRQHLGPMVDGVERDTRQFIGLWQSTFDVLVLLDFLDLADDLTAEYDRAARAYDGASFVVPNVEARALRQTSKRVAA